MMQAIRNQMMLAAKMATADRAPTKLGAVTSYDPDNYAVVVLLRPEDITTGWLPLVSSWSGNNWGMFAPPSIGDLVEVQFVDGSLEAGFACQRFYTDQNRPLNVPSGEFWLVHKSGSLLKFHNDGTVELHAATAINSSAPQWTHTGPMTINDGDLKVQGDITDRYATQSRTVNGMRSVYNGHTHSDPQGGSVSTPTTEM